MIRKTTSTINSALRWKIVEEYLKCDLSEKEIGERYQLSETTIKKTVKDLYKELQAIIDTRALVSSQKGTGKYEYLVNSIKSNNINDKFFSLLSEDDSLVLTDAEYLYCEFFTSHGDEQRSVTDAGLDIGLNRNLPGYIDAIRIRSFYLRKKPNVAEYIRSLQKEKLQVMVEGKETLQTELLSLVEKLRNHPDTKTIPSLLKSIELLGKSIGAFEDRQVVEHIGGDLALDNILQKAKEANKDVEVN